MGILINSDRYFPKGLGLREEVQEALSGEYHSKIVQEIRDLGYTFERAGVTIYLAKEFGFCYGVDRAVEYAYEARKKFPDRKIYLANEIIHNPHVNERLRQMGVQLLSSNLALEEKLKEIQPQDVVLISAFGATVPEMKKLQELGCIMVDTTCGSVMSVWKNVERYAREGYTAIVHGKYNHEETLATCSRVTQYPGGQYIVVRDLAEAQLLCDYIEGRGDKESFLKKFQQASSKGFDPDKHLKAVGVANQTTMLSGESLQIAEMVRKSMEKIHGKETTAKRFQTFDTICSATQDRQDAVRELLQKPLDFMLVIGGYNSSNTTHLAEIAIEHTKAYHIDDVSCLISKDQLRHKPVGEQKEIIVPGWLSQGKVTVGITSGASTPNNKVGEVIERLFELHGKEAK